MSKRVPKHKRRYPKAFTKYWDNVETCGIMEEDDFKEDVYLGWKAGTRNGPIRAAQRVNLFSAGVW